MKLLCLVFSCLCVLIGTCTAQTQNHDSYRNLLTPRVRAQKLAAPAHLKSYIQDDKLRISLRDAILLTLENNSDIQIEESSIEARKFTLLGTYSPFDPLLQGNVNVNRYSYPGYTQLQGIGESSNAVLNTLTQSALVTYNQTFTTGTNIIAGLTTSKSSTNSSFYYINPYYNTSLNFQFTQPLLRNAGRFANTAPIAIARRGLAQSRAAFLAEVNDAVLQVIGQYWTAVQARGALEVQKRALNLAQVSYERDKRALELGALPPLDISRSESEFAARKVQAIQADYVLAQAEEALRLTIGADQDPQLNGIPLELTENPEPAGDLVTVDLDSVLSDSLAGRPEVEASHEALAGDDTSIHLARNQLKPDLSLQGFFQSNGSGGNQYDLLTGRLTSPGGLSSSFSQLFGFGYPGYGAQLALNLPIKNRAAQSRLGDALVAKTRDLYTDRQVQEQITRQARDAVHQFDTAKLSLAAAMTSLDLAQKSLAADQRKFELGAETNFFVLDSQSRLANAELVLLQTRVTYQLALAAINHATGKLLEPYRLQIEGASR